MYEQPFTNKYLDDKVQLKHNMKYLSIRNVYVLSIKFVTVKGRTLNGGILHIWNQQKKALYL